MSKGLVSKDSPYPSFNWWRSNFNMPVTYLFGGSTWDANEGNVNTISPATSFNLSGFTAGFEICVGNAVWYFENNGGSTYNVDTLLSARWADPSLNTIYWSIEDYRFQTSLPAGYWEGIERAGNIGVAGWEVNGNGTYHYRAGAVGTPNITSGDKPATMSNVPSTTQLSSLDRGAIWVEGDDLHYIVANKWEHTMVGTNTGVNAGTSKEGSFWLDGSVLHWVGEDGYVYTPQWEVKQFASSFSNSSNGAEYAGTSAAGTIWVDIQFGLTHIAYIAEDGYKYLTGAGDDPY